MSNRQPGWGAYTVSAIATDNDGTYSADPLDVTVLP